MNLLRFRIFLAACVLTCASLLARDADSKLVKWPQSIRMIPLDSFSAWPGVTGSRPADLSLLSSRLWFIWPKAIISLKTSGDADAETLLALFASQNADWEGKAWTPAGGLICSDGRWRRLDGSGGVLHTLNLHTGAVERQSVEKMRVDAIHPGPDGGLVVVSGSSLYAVAGDGSSRLLTGAYTPAAMVAVSPDTARIAWVEDSSRGIVVRSLDPRENARIPLEGHSRPWMMAWMGDALFIALPGRLGAAAGAAGIRYLSDERLPKRWYRIIGGSNHLLVHSPESPAVALLSEKNEAGSKIGLGDFSLTLQFHALEAGLMLENEGLPERAEAYYGWVLPLIRKQRSLKPLNVFWADLEDELTRRRILLRDQLDWR